MSAERGPPPPGTRFQGGPVVITVAMLEHYLAAIPTHYLAPIPGSQGEARAIPNASAARLIPAPMTIGLVFSLLAEPSGIARWALGLLELAEAKFPAPVYPGSTLSAHCEIVSCTPVSGGRSVVVARDEGLLADGTTVFRAVRRILARGNANDA